MSAAKVNGTTVTQLDGKAGSVQSVTADDVKDTDKLSKLLTQLVADVAEQKRQHAAQRLDFEDQPVDTGGATVQFAHGFGGRVRWWVVDWTSDTDTYPQLARHVSTDDDTLVLASYAIGTLTLRVEAAG